MIVLPLDEADHQAVMNFLLPDLVRNGALIPDCTVLRDRCRPALQRSRVRTGPSVRLIHS
jgi:hypothetical protein